MNRTQIYNYVVLMWVMLLASACNNDIFIDGPMLEEDLHATVEGDGGTAVFRIPLKGLEYIGLDLTSEGKQFCKYYNDRGELIDGASPESEVAATVVFDNDICHFEIIRKGSELTFWSMANPMYRSTWTIRLEYDYAVRFITVEVLQGQPLQLIDVAYTSDLQIDDKALVKTHRFGINNGGSIPQTFAVFPYLNRLSSIFVKSDKKDYWLGGMEVKMPVPVFLNGDWLLRELSDIVAGHDNDIQTADDTFKVDVEVPANSKVSVVTDVTYSKAEARGNMTFLNVALDRRITADFTVTSFCPTSYEIRVEDAQ